MTTPANVVAKQNAEEYAAGQLYKMRTLLDIDGKATGIAVSWDFLKLLILQAHTAGSMHANRQMAIDLGINPDEEPPQEKP